jgi:cytidyltransferase-like protein
MYVYTGGTFDNFHPGHAHLIRLGLKLSQVGGDALYVVAVNSDKFVRDYKGRWPTQKAHERMSAIRNLYPDAHVVLNTGDANSTQTIQYLHDNHRADAFGKIPPTYRRYPDVVLVGSDWAKSDYYAQMGFTQLWLDARNIDIIYAHRVGDWASSAMRDA